MKKMITISIVIIGSLILSGVLFMSCSPQFGGKISKEKKAVYAQSVANYKDGKFTIPVPMMTSESFTKDLKKMFTSVPNSQPEKALEVLPIDTNQLSNTSQEDVKITWFGHSSFLIQMNSLNILLDPMLTENASPVPIGRTKRFNDLQPISIDNLPNIDVVVYSHDHYDHLDYKTLMQLKDKVGRFYVPLGVGSHLTKWGVEEQKITEHDWWDATEFEGVKFVCTPSIHFSGRGLFDRASTLWSSWSLISDNDRIFFSGDSGYGPHFKEIGEKYGPFDISLMECGQYDDSWKHIHMNPEESVQASIDLKSKVMMPMHWAGFKLANHSWTEPVTRALAEAKELEVTITTPKIGEIFSLNDEKLRTNKWWSE